MGLIDIIILIIIGAGAIRGFMRGFIHQLASVAGLIIGFLAARALYLVVAEKLSMYIPSASMTILQIIAFIAIWIIIPLLFTLVASLLTHAAEMLSLKALNHFLGVLLGVIKWVLIVGLLINVLDYLDTDNRVISQTKKEESMLYYPIKDIISSFFPVAKDITNEYITI
ncbi:CvpA family protein [Bacteroides sp. 51]|uniref:CvpA family protein n=1 Tax=Bacteroides sp. 51 TaxID=2302938 RepID=UPI0013D0FB8C|nr:CvpA family protein [Bacteroides sp. 51]NDV80428.1 CvpA family protein [Bacteroides sp. 51]